ncbi:NADPH oxidase activator 1 isoform X3 [Alligator sinensis]|uniref:NADPH oxidase activator 1 isoform X3 n=1 Tax=Alligator sinensis TaxID=38654 RepID=A0A3Q0GKS6_ALLSI|nr:NADPH oxidase activator 1 isoform X3 [Alligator sinensis]
MAYRDLVRGWHEGVLAVDKGDWESALKIFSSIEEPSARICFNIGCVHLLTGNLEGAVQAFDQTVTKDNRLAVGFFQRGFVCLQLDKYEEALYDSRMALTLLRYNPFIDYKQLGLRHMLYAWEEHLFLDPMQIPAGELFRPRKKEVEQLDSKDFLGKPKVISSVIPNDEYIGFEPLRPQTKGFYKPSVDAVQDCDSGYYRVLGHYYPKDSEEVALKASSLVFVLTKDTDGWATVIHNGQKLCVPTSLLEPVHAPKADKWKINNGIPLPPDKVPPSRPHLKQKDKQQPGSTEGEGINADDDNSQTNFMQVPLSPKEAFFTVDGTILLKVHCSYTIAVQVSEALSLSDLRSLLKEKFCQDAEHGKLSYRHSSTGELIAVSGEEDLGKMWQQVMDGKLTLWCQGPDSCSDRPVLYQMVAEYRYIAEGPEDLEFNEGDTLDILAEVNEDWLEGRCNGKIGIFPKCFAVRASTDPAQP